jgi:hypothetical protein
MNDSIRRTIQFALLLNRFEDDALRRVVKTGGYRSASEALRYLIRREDPEGHLHLMPDDGQDRSHVVKAWRRLATAIAAVRSTDGSMPAELLAMIPGEHGPSFDADVELLDTAIPEMSGLVGLLKETREWTAKYAGIHLATDSATKKIGDCIARIDKALAALEGPSQ